MPDRYEEIRRAAIQLLSKRLDNILGANQYDSLSKDVAVALYGAPPGTYKVPQRLNRDDADLFLEVFWDLFRQGIITLGGNDNNREFPHFRVSSLGRRMLENEDAYFVHDVSEYEARVKKEVPDIDEVTVIYLKEAVQAFRAGCSLSATVMLGVAMEHTFLLLLETIELNPSHSKFSADVSKERTILRKTNKFWEYLEGQLKSFPPVTREDLETRFMGIQSIVRNFRNDSGHPSGKIIDRQQVFVLLQLFIPYCKKAYQLRAYFAE